MAYFLIRQETQNCTVYISWLIMVQHENLSALIHQIDAISLLSPELNIKKLVGLDGWQDGEELVSGVKEILTDTAKTARNGHHSVFEEKRENRYSKNQSWIKCTFGRRRVHNASGNKERRQETLEPFNTVTEKKGKIRREVHVSLWMDKDLVSFLKYEYLRKALDSWIMFLISMSIFSLKGSVTKFLASGFFMNHLCSQIRGDIRKSRCNTGIHDTGGKFCHRYRSCCWHRWQIKIINTFLIEDFPFGTGVNDNGGAPWAANISAGFPKNSKRP